MGTTFNRDLFNQLPVVGILRFFKREAVEKLVPASMAGGLVNIEVTMNSEGATDLIQLACRLMGDKGNVGAGTVDFKPFLRGPFQNVGTCGGRISQAPLLDGTGLAACAIALFALGYAVLERRARRPRP